MTEFKREDRYLVIKLKDASLYLDELDQGFLDGLKRKIDQARQQAGRPELVTVVVEHDWPEYETTWRAVEARVRAAQPPESPADLSSPADASPAVAAGSASSDAAPLLRGKGSPDGLYAEVMRNLADHAKFEASVRQAAEGSFTSQKAACLEWLAASAEYQLWVSCDVPSSPYPSPSRTLIDVEKDLVTQFRHLLV